MKQQRNYVHLGNPGGENQGCCLGAMILMVLFVVMVAIGIVHKYF